jgi:hypothetical protein
VVRILAGEPTLGPHGSGFQTAASCLTAPPARRKPALGCSRWGVKCPPCAILGFGQETDRQATHSAGRRRDCLFEAATTWFSAERRGLGECGRGSREIQSGVHQPKHMRTGQRACGRVRQQPRPPSQAFCGAAGIVRIRRVRIVGCAVLCGSAGALEERR